MPNADPLHDNTYYSCPHGYLWEAKTCPKCYPKPMRTCDIPSVIAASKVAAKHLEYHKKMMGYKPHVPRKKAMFDFDPEQLKKLSAWIGTKDLDEYSGASGGRFTYQFTPTSLGMVSKVIDNLKKDEIDLTDYTSW